MIKRNARKDTFMAQLVELIKSDHQDLLNKLKEAREMSGKGHRASERRDAIDDLIRSYVLHSRPEILIVYPFLDEISDVIEKETEELRAEHHEFDQKLKNIEEHPEWDRHLTEKLDDLFEILEPHFKEEEEVLIPELEKRLSAEELQQIEADYRQAQDEIRNGVSYHFGGRHIQNTGLNLDL